MLLNSSKDGKRLLGIVEVDDPSPESDREMVKLYLIAVAFVVLGFGVALVVCF